MNPALEAALLELAGMFAVALAKGAAALMQGSTLDDAAALAIENIEDARARRKFPDFKPGV
jgi:hypothetical protein